jgi:hypothetical protein
MPPTNCKGRSSRNEYFKRHEHSNRCARYQFLEIAAFCRQLALLIFESRA